MGDVAVENPANIVAPHKRQAPSNAIPNIDSLEGISSDDSDEYSTLKKLQRHLEFVFLQNFTCGSLLIIDRYINLQEEYIKDEQRCVEAETIWVITERCMQESQARACPSPRRNQAHTKCASGDRAVHGSNRPEVSLGLPRIMSRF